MSKETYKPRVLNADFWQRIKNNLEITEIKPELIPTCPTCNQRVEGVLVISKEIPVYHNFCDRLKKIVR